MLREQPAFMLKPNKSYSFQNKKSKSGVEKLLKAECPRIALFNVDYLLCTAKCVGGTRKLLKDNCIVKIINKKLL